MSDLTASLTAMEVCFLLVFLSSASYAFSSDLKRFSSRLIESDAFDSSIRHMFGRYEISYFNIENNRDNQEKDILRSNEEIIRDIQKNHKRSTYLRAAIETLAILGFVSAFYWGTEHSSDDFDYDISFDTLENK